MNFELGIPVPTELARSSQTFAVQTFAHLGKESVGYFCGAFRIKPLTCS